MKKNAILTVLILALLLCLLCISCAGAEETAEEKAPAGSGECGGYYYDYYDDGTAVITIYSGRDETLTIPKELDGYRVIGIGDMAFYYCDSLTSVTIPDSVITVVANPFADCRKLTDIIVSPDHPTLETIDGVLFDKTEKKLVTYPRGFTDERYIIPQGIRIIGDSAFYGCDSLASVTIPDSVTIIGNSAFCGCDSLLYMKIGYGVTSIGNSAFAGCSSLKSIAIPDSVSSIGNGAFYYCDSLTSVTIPDSVTSIGSKAFSACAENLTLTVGRGSCAEQYCIDNGISYTYAD